MKKKSKVWISLTLDRVKELIHICSIGETRQEVYGHATKQFGDMPVFCMELLGDMRECHVRMNNWLLRHGVPENEVDEIFQSFAEQFKNMAKE